MEHEVGAVGPTSAISARVRELRQRHGWTADQLAEQMTKVGVPWSRIVVTKFETGRRPSVSVEELLALAYVLDVAPVHLMIPTDEPNETRYRVLPSGTSLPFRAARQWVRGFQPIRPTRPGGPMDGRRYFSEVPADEYPVVPRFSKPADDDQDGSQEAGSSGER